MENYRLLFQPEEDVTLRPSRSYSIEFDDPNAGRQTCRLFFTGETALFYQWKNEPDYPLLYRRIDDALSTDACKAQFCVKLDGREYPKKLYDKLLWKPKLSYLMLHSYSDQWQGGIFAKGERIEVREGGYLRMRFEVRYLRDGMSRHDVMVPPDEAYGFDFPSGTYDWREIRLPLTIPDEKTASVCVWIEGLLYDGTLSLERPYLKSGNGYNILPDFSTNAPGRPRFNWIGQNLSRKEWPEFEISLNGKLFYKGGIFERSHRYSEAELPIPDGLLRQEGNRLTFRLISDYRDALPYHLHEVGIVSEPDDSFRVISCPEQVTVSRAFPVLIQSHTTNPLEITSEDGGVRGVRLPDRLREGLNVILLQCDEPANDVEFTLRDGMTEQTCTIRQALLRREDNVLTGTGDMIYIHQRTEDTIHYLCWYLANHVGNLITIRPTYRWSGTRMLNPRMWEEFVRLVNAMGMKYAHMLDGRELPGGCANPNATMLAGPGFLGRQKHEQDGAYAYWGVMDLSDDYDEERFYDMRILDVLHDPETASLQNTPEDYHASGDKVVLYRDLSVAPDMESASRQFVRQLSAARYDATRHTGPSTLFKYFFQAGYSWVGAELMYGPMELVLAALRGAARCYGISGMGGHLAVQWSTTPHDTEERYRRYRLALFVSYMQGLTEINTEEGLWHLEEYYSHFHRFDPACKRHLQEQQNFYRYVSTHSRTGRFYTSVAFVSGRYDGWQCFGRSTVWGRPDFPFDRPEESWDLLNLFYPLSRLDAIYRHPCPKGPVGFYTGTPRGNVDILPIESGCEDYRHYRVLVFLGYNKAVAKDCDKLSAYLEQGGTVILGWPHLSITTEREEVVTYRHAYIDHPLVNAIAGGAPDESEFVRDTLNGKGLEVFSDVVTQDADILAVTDSGRPLVLTKKIGKGKVCFVNAKGYPAEPALRPVYEKIIRSASDTCNEQENSFIECGDDVQFTIYEQPDGSRHIYLLATDWYNPSAEPRRATLRLDGKRYPVAVPFGNPVKMIIRQDAAVWTDSRDCDVLSIDGNTAKLQGYGTGEFTAALKGILKEYNSKNKNAVVFGRTSTVEMEIV